MRIKLPNQIALVTLGLFVATFGVVTWAEECKVLGALTKLEFAADGKSAKAVVRNSKTGEDTTLAITDELTLDRLKKKPIEPGREVRAHFEKDGQNTCQLFERAAGGHDRGDGGEYFIARPKN